MRDSIAGRQGDNRAGTDDAIAELERQQGINEDILRILTLRVEELEEGPSAQLRKLAGDDVKLLRWTIHDLRRTASRPNSGKMSPKLNWMPSGVTTATPRTKSFPRPVSSK